MKLPLFERGVQVLTGLQIDSIKHIYIGFIQGGSTKRLKEINIEKQF